MAKFEFVNYTDPKSMRDAFTSIRIRQHAMGQVGAIKSQSRAPRRVGLEQPRAENDKSQDFQTIRQEPWAKIQSKVEEQMIDDRALYEPSIRSLACKMDPFETASISIDVTVRTLLEYFTFYASRWPNTWTYSSSPFLPDDPAEHAKSISRTINSALSDDLLGSSLLATAASRLCYVDEDALQPQIKDKELILTQQALQVLRMRLAKLSTRDSGSVEALVAGTLHLGGAAFYRGDVAAAGQHIEAAVTLANSIGGTSRLTDPYVRGRIISFDDLISCVKLRPCLIDSSIYDPGPVPPVATYGDSVQDTGIDCTAEDLLLPHSLIMPSTLQLIVLEVLHCYQAGYKMLNTDYTDSSQALANRQWLTLHTIASRNRLLSFSTADSRTDVVRIALLMWTLLPSKDMRQATIASAIAPRLKSRMVQIPLRDWSGYEDIRFWCLLIGHCCSGEGTALQRWFAGTVSERLILKKSEESAEVDDIAALEIEGKFIDLQKRFFYHGPVQQPATKALTKWIVGIATNGRSTT